MVMEVLMDNQKVPYCGRADCFVSELSKELIDECEYLPWTCDCKDCELVIMCDAGKRSCGNAMGYK